MILFDEFTLANGLRVLVHPDPNTNVAVVNILYNVGSRDELEDKTGFAHLFEHLMFGGSKNIPSYDEPLQRVGGENNAFTSPDITNYYLTVPAANLETAFWLESDRMLSLSFEPRVLEVQQKVVIEEFKQRYLNQPYGDTWLKLRPLAYQVHPYRWPTIGADIAHIAYATMDDVKSFFSKFYTPSNAYMVVAGKVDTEEVRKLAEKWFGPIPAGRPYHRALPQEPLQTEARVAHASAKVPLSALYKVYHMPARTSEDYHSADFVSDVLGRGKSSRLYDRLVKEKKIFNSINAYVTGSIEPGLLCISGKLNPQVSMELADQAIQEEIDSLILGGPSEKELQKVKNQAEAALVFGEMEVLNRAMSLAYGCAMGDPHLANQEVEKVQAVTRQKMMDQAIHILRPENSSTLYYEAQDGN